MLILLLIVIIIIIIIFFYRFQLFLYMKVIFYNYCLKLE